MDKDSIDVRQSAGAGRAGGGSDGRAGTGAGELDGADARAGRGR